MNTLDNILEYADIENIPVRKWMYMNIILNNKNLDLYINGYLKIRKELSSLPKQNDDDFWVNMFGGLKVIFLILDIMLMLLILMKLIV